MRRRDFLAGLGVAVWPITAKAQQPAIPVIGFISSGSSQPQADRVAKVREGLREVGYVEGNNVKIEYRWADGRYDQLPALATDLVARQVKVIVAAGGVTSGLAAKAATSTIPIVFTMGDDPVKFGLVASLNRPGGNITGSTQLAPALEAKRLELLRELVPKASVIGLLANPSFPASSDRVKDARAAANALKLQVIVVEASKISEFEAAFATFSQRHVGAISVTTDPFYADQRNALVALAARHRIPTMYSSDEFTSAGGLVSYGTNIPDSYRQVGIYAGRILQGEKPENLPVVQATKFKLVINLKVAKALGLSVPQTLQVAADDVIE